MSGIVQIESRSRTSTDSWCKTFARGKLRELAPSTTDRPSIGTTVTVLDFMYNLPVRRGCLSEAIDFEFCLQHLEGIALSHPEVSFTLRNDVTEEKHFQTHRTNSVLDIFAQLFGAQRAATLKHTLIKKKHFAVEAYISLEGHTSKQLQFVYLNKRLLRKTRIHKLFHNVIKKYVLGFHAKSAALCGSPSKLRNKQPDTADGGLLSKGSGPLYRITESYKFRKEMLTYVQELLRDHTETLLGTRHSAITLPKFLMDVLSSQACHGAIRFGSFLEKSECKSILKALSNQQHSYPKPQRVPATRLLEKTHGKTASTP
ncbi:hypothetical protein HPB52_021789 [Rhipicephalus sanguineus]|uniref:Uncharacterized protein n=1 Tax=Rhipicephalus sanguineus TaxID=34632 RepID=A0A9D4QC39_RHISA|nr:hypothetical protein HPB52_021789 [Rhipicephalus sanguineus]